MILEESNLQWESLSSSSRQSGERQKKDIHVFRTSEICLSCFLRTRPGTRFHTARQEAWARVFRGSRVGIA